MKYRIKRFNSQWIRDLFLNSSTIENLEKLKEKKMIEKKLKSDLKEVLFYVIFAIVCLMLAYNIFDNVGFYSQKNLKNFYSAGEKSSFLLEVNYLKSIFLF